MMQLDFKKIYEDYNGILPIKGVIHVGACTGEEREIYAECGIKRVEWFEANPETFEILKQNLESDIKFSQNRAHKILLAHLDDLETPFFITSNFRSASSSMLPLAKHKVHYPKIEVTKELSLKTRRFDTFAEINRFDWSDINLLNMDVQGAELKVLLGFGSLVEKFDYVYSEVNTAHLYEGCVLIDELDAYLYNYGFVRRETHMTNFEWGDALYVKRTKFE